MLKYSKIFAVISVCLCLFFWFSACGGGGGGASGASIPADEYTTHNEGGWGGGGSGGSGSGSGVTVQGGTTLNVTSYSYNNNTYYDVTSLTRALKNDNASGQFTITFTVAGESTPRTARVTKTSDGYKLEHQYKATCVVINNGNSTSTAVFYYIAEGLNLASLTTSNMTGWQCSDGSMHYGSIVTGVRGDITLTAVFANNGGSSGGDSGGGTSPVPTPTSFTPSVTKTELFASANTSFNDEAVITITGGVGPFTVTGDTYIESVEQNSTTFKVHIKQSTVPTETGKIWFLDNTGASVTITDTGTNQTGSVGFTLKNRYTYKLHLNPSEWPSGTTEQYGDPHEVDQLSVLNLTDAVTEMNSYVVSPGRSISALFDITSMTYFKNVEFKSANFQQRDIILNILPDFTYTISNSRYKPQGITQNGTQEDPYLLHFSGSLDEYKEINFSMDDTIGRIRVTAGSTAVGVGASNSKITIVTTDANNLPANPIAITIKDLDTNTPLTNAAESDPANIYAQKTFYVKIVNPPYCFVYVPGNGSTISDMYVSDHEVTQGEYGEDFASTGRTGGINCGYGTTQPEAGYGLGTDYPVYYVNWYDALIYCNLRSMAEELEPCYTIKGSTDPADWGLSNGFGGGKTGPNNSDSDWDAAIVDTSKSGYRLPTQEEWLYLANGGKERVYYIYSGSHQVGDVAWYSVNASGTTHPVRADKAGFDSSNKLVIYDMCGNVGEWCFDGDGAGLHGIFGGSWSSPLNECRLDFSEGGSCSNFTSDLRDSNIGFRVVRKAP